MIIADSPREASDGARLPVFSPRTGRVVACIPNATETDVADAVQAAVDCFAGREWQDFLATPRQAPALDRLGDLLTHHRDELAHLESVDCGKPITQARDDLQTCIDLLHYYAGLLPAALRPTPLLCPDPKFTAELHKIPVGPVGCITPWNYPLLQAVCKVAPALAAGCPTVLKPSPCASLTCLRLGELVRDAGFPRGALGVVTGGPPGGDAGRWLATHPALAKLSFTGSTRAGRDILHASADRLRPTALELGGKGAMLVFDDADLPSAVDWAMVGIFSGAGQVCSATSRLLLHRPIAASFLDLLVTRTARLRVGDPLEEATHMGPLVSAEQQARVLTMIDTARQAGCGVLQPAALPTASELAGGYFVPPTLLLDVPSEAEAWREEIFGPVLAVRLFDTEEEAVALANDTVYGLADAVMTRCPERCQRVSRQLQSGTVWHNCSQATFVTTPFGGQKASGFGREMGAAGLEEYLALRTVTAAQCGHSWNAFT